ncbi:MAG: metal-dependent transcriptional regulator [Schleiferiaceae bacterium]|jgi:DtxR family Mn-dependent transcriptional regulator|nr:metal-dependent transcriptional regulator [Schleiferiaceae bacterium]
MATHTEENYLKALLHLVNAQGEISVTELSSRLKISAPTANSMIKKLHAKKLVNYRKYKPLSLTEKGKKHAASIIRKHRLTEMFLVEKMGFGWEQVHAIAEQVEHVDSDLFFDRMDEILGFPTVDPHGSPIPDKNGNIVWKAYDKLSDCTVGSKVKLSGLMNSSSDFLAFLNSKQLGLGTELTIEKVESFDKSMTILYGNNLKEVFSHMVCDNLLVEK